MHVTTRRRHDDSTIYQADRVPAAADPTADTDRIVRDRRTAETDILLIPDRDGTAGVFDKNTGRRLGTIDEDGVPIDPMDAPAWSTANAILFGAFAGFVLAATISLLAFRYWIPIH